MLFRELFWASLKGFLERLIKQLNCRLSVVKKGWHHSILPVAISQVEKKTFRGVKSGKNLFLNGYFYVGVKPQISIGWEKKEIRFVKVNKQIIA